MLNWFRKSGKTQQLGALGGRSRPGRAHRGLAASTLVLATLLSACSGSSSADSVAADAAEPPFKVAQEGKLTVAFADGNLPQLALGEGGEVLGTDGALLTAVAEKYNLELNLVNTASDAHIISIQQNKADVSNGKYYTEERAEQVLYTFPYYRDYTGIYLRKDYPYDGPESLIDAKFGTVQGYVFGPYIEETYGKDHITYFKDIPQLISALTNGQIDVMVNGSGAKYKTYYLPHKDEFTFYRVKAGEMGFPASMIENKSYNVVRCDNQALADAINEVQKELYETGKWDDILRENGLTPEEDKAPLEQPKQLCN